MAAWLLSVRVSWYLTGRAEPLRRDAGQDGLGGAVGAVAEAAAHVRHDHADLVLGVAEQRREALAEAVDVLGGLVEGQLAGGVAAVRPPDGERAAHLHRGGDDALVDDADLDDLVGRGERAVDIAGGLGLGVAEVGAERLEEERRAGLQRLLGIDDGRQRVVVDLDERRRRRSAP